MAQTPPRRPDEQEPPAPPPAPPPTPPTPADAPAGPPPAQEESDAERAERARIQEEATRTAAEARTAHLPQPGAPVPGALSPADAASGGKTVKMNFPRPVSLTRNDYTTVEFPAGVQEVPEELKDHPYLKAHGVTPV